MDKKLKMFPFFKKKIFEMFMYISKQKINIVKYAQLQRNECAGVHKANMLNQAMGQIK